MKKINLLLLVLGLSFSLQSVSATNPISLESYQENFVKTEKKNGLLIKAKKWFKKAADKVKIKKLATAALILGLASLAGWLIAAAGVGFAGMLIVMGLMALAADILAIIVLVKTGKDKGEHKKSRRMAVWGLVAGLLTGLLPIALLILVLVSI